MGSLRSINVTLAKQGQEQQCYNGNTLEQRVKEFKNASFGKQSRIQIALVIFSGMLSYFTENFKRHQISFVIND